ncbi:MAG: YIP1 family protein [Anaerolineae bacterium]|nr:YIP1 family protein [Anaerolineae bacterium]
MTDEMTPGSEYNDFSGWPKIWLKAITSPSEATFEEIAESPSATMGNAFVWVVLTAIIATVFSVMSSLLNEYVYGVTQGGGMGIGLVACITPIASIIGILVFTGLSNGVAKMMGGTGTFDKLLFTTAAYSLPIALLTGAASLIPVVDIIGACLLGIYSLVLMVIAVKAVHQFEWGQAVAAGIAPTILLICIAAICVMGSVALLGPAIEGSFQEIIDSLE